MIVFTCIFWAECSVELEGLALWYKLSSVCL